MPTKTAVAKKATKAHEMPLGVRGQTSLGEVVNAWLDSMGLYHVKITFDEPAYQKYRLACSPMPPIIPGDYLKRVVKYNFLVSALLKDPVQFIRFNFGQSAINFANELIVTPLVNVEVFRKTQKIDFKIWSTTMQSGSRKRPATSTPRKRG
jgi:hypothetical protein